MGSNWYFSNMKTVFEKMNIFSVNFPQSLGLKITYRLWGLTQIKFQQKVHCQKGKQGWKEDGPDL